MNILLVAAPYDSGHHNKRLGRGAPVLLQGLATALKSAGHSVRSEEVFIESTFPTEVTTSFEVSRKISGFVSEARDNGEFPIVFSGNCNTAAIGTLSGLNNDSGVIWFDCHADFNTPETTIGGFLDGMALAMVTGECWSQLTHSVKGFKPVPENHIMLIGARDLDPLEEKRLSASRITQIPPGLLKQNKKVLDNISLALKSVYLHIDLDVLDPGFTKINSYSTDGGILPDQLYPLITTITEKYKVAAIAFTAYDPELDVERKAQAVVNKIVSLIV